MVFSAKLYVVVLCVFTLALVANNAYSTQPVVTYFYSNQPPFEFVDSSGQPNGTAIEQIKSLFSHINYHVDFEFNSVNRGVLNLHQGIYDVSTAVSPGDALKSQFWVSDQPLYQIQFVAVRKSDTPPLNSDEEPKNVIFAAMVDNAFPFIDSFLSKHIDYQRYDVSNIEQGLHLVKINRIPYFLTYFSGHEDFSSDNLTIDVLEEMPVFLIVSKQHPLGLDLITKINDGLKKR